MVPLGSMNAMYIVPHSRRTRDVAADRSPDAETTPRNTSDFTADYSLEPALRSNGTELALN